MPLIIGVHISPYDFLAPLGAVGFGEVDKPRDTRHRAIKFLAQAVARF